MSSSWAIWYVAGLLNAWGIVEGTILLRFLWKSLGLAKVVRSAAITTGCMLLNILCWVLITINANNWPSEATPAPAYVGISNITAFFLGSLAISYALHSSRRTWMGEKLS